jgi:3-oxoacyl-[acyl-carrier-protein] synthase II
MDRFAQFSIAAADMLLKDAEYAIGDSNAARVGVILGVGIGGLRTIEFYHEKLVTSGPSKISPFLVPMMISNLGPGQVAIFTGARASNMVATTACASALHAIGAAWNEIVLGRCDAVITGGVEASVTPLAVAGFTAMRALSTTRNDEPAKASRPFDKNRDGFVIAEGAGFLLLESLDSAHARGAKIYGEIAGFGASCDAHHITAPEESGEGMAQAMQSALDDGKIRPEQVGHINAHGTSTPLNDACETRAIKKVFGTHASKLQISGTKSMTGHLLGAAGGLESVFTVMALHEGVLPGTINLTTPDPECDLNYLSSGSVRHACEYAACNSFGFGGTNASIIFKACEG